MKRMIAIALLLAMALTLAACGGAKAETPALVGTWADAEGNEMVFNADGTGKCFTTNGLLAECTWSALEDGSFELKAMVFGKATVTITDNTITWYDIEYTKAG